MRTGITFDVAVADRARLEAIVAAPTSAQKHVWRAKIILMSDDGSVIGRNMQCHRHQEFIRFLNAIEAQLPKYKAVHVILNNYATHKQPKVRAWLARHPRWTFHFVPTSCSSLNAVEGFFAKLPRRSLKYGVFHSVIDLQANINRFVREHNQDPKPFICRADPDEIIAAVKRGHQALESIH